MEKFTKWLIIGALALYVASPVDLAPGPIDDAIAIMIYLVSQRRKFVAEAAEHEDAEP